MGIIEYDLKYMDVRPSRLRRLLYFAVWFMIVSGIPFISSYLWARFYEGRDDIESLGCAAVMVACISPYVLWLLWRGAVYIASVTNRNLGLRKLALFAISIGYGSNYTQEEWEDDQDFYYFYDPNGPNGPNIYDHHDHHH